MCRVARSQTVRKRTDVWDLANERMRNEAKRRGCRLEIVVRGVVDAVRDVLEMKKSICKGKVRAKFTLQFLKARGSTSEHLSSLVLQLIFLAPFDASHTWYRNDATHHREMVVCVRARTHWLVCVVGFIRDMPRRAPS